MLFEGRRDEEVLVEPDQLYQMWKETGRELGDLRLMRNEFPILKKHMIK